MVAAGREAHAGEPRPLQRVLTFLDMLLGGTALVVEGQNGEKTSSLMRLSAASVLASSSAISRE